MSKFDYLNVPDQWNQYFTKYPQGYTILEALLNWVQQVDDMVDNVNNWNDYLDEFVKQFDSELQDTVMEVLTDWEASGILSDLLNRAVVDKTDIYQNALANVMMDMYKGKSVIIDCWGDSTYWGQVSAGTGQVANPAPLVLQTSLQKFFNNNLITVNNHGIAGNQTTNALRTWDNDMKNSPASIVYINYGLNDHSGSNPSGANDPAITPEQYKDNLIQMVTIARNHGKIVILEAQGVEFLNHSGDWLGRMVGAEQFANAAKQVANSMNAPFIDQGHFIKKYLQSKENIPAAFPDGIHPSQDVYIQKGVNMLYPLIRPYNIDGAATIPAGVSGFMGEYENTDNNTGSRTSGLLFSDFGVRALINVVDSGYDLYAAFVQYGNGSTNVEVKIDGQVVTTLSQNDPDWVSTYGVDSETMITQKIPAGLHLIELNNKAGTGRVGIYYLRTHKTRHFPVAFVGSTSPLPSYTISKRQTVLEGIDIINDGATNVQIITDIPTSRSLYTLDVEVDAKFAKGAGYMLFTKNASDTGLPQGGLVIYLDNSSGYLRIAEGKGKAFMNATTLGATDLSTASHKIKTLVTTTGLCTFYVDGSSVGTYQMQKPHIGGFLGFYSNLASQVRIDRVTMN
jgi:hypothetical protein